MRRGKGAPIFIYFLFYFYLFFCIQNIKNIYRGEKICSSIRSEEQEKEIKMQEQVVGGKWSLSTVMALEF